MHFLYEVCQWLDATAWGTALRESVYVYPVIETIHTLAIALLVGTVAFLDLRLLGFILKRIPVSELARQVLPWTWTGFVVMLISGLLLFWAEASKMYVNPAFRWKMALLLLVGLNPLVFHLTIYKSVRSWDVHVITPVRARLAAVISLTLWSAIVVAGRAIAYFA